MSKVNEVKKIYAVRDKETKKILRNTKCKGGSYYAQYPACQRRCNDFNEAHKTFNLNTVYEVGEYAVVDIDEWKELVKRI